MIVTLRRTGALAKASGISAFPFGGGTILFDRGFATVDIPDDKAAAFLADLPGKKYHYKQAKAGEAPKDHVLQGVLSTKSPDAETGTQDKSAFLTFQEIQELGLRAMDCKEVRTMTEDVGKGKTRKLYSKSDIEALVASKKGGQK
jgi:hypothetical protein